ncbi:MAG TPA: nucleotide exchange factor GrpE [Oligoflexia bacterium]|nr:nucleotide exchange factor GrpE [Oligoflexia bacterium]HMR25646.1 nucleotide exchange factor GrpE [Oligoflexia bacterium]
MGKHKKEQTVEHDVEELKNAEENTQNIEDDEQDQSFVDWYDRYVRLSADFENFRKRVQKEKSDLIKYGHESLMIDLLPVIDNFQRAVEHAKQAKDIEAIQTGIQMIFNQLINNLEKHGVSSKSAKGKEFDPNQHEAISHVESDDVDSNHIIEEMQKAYFLHDKLLRPALVSVSKGPATQSDPSTKESSDPTQEDD